MDDDALTACAVTTRKLQAFVASDRRPSWLPLVSALASQMSKSYHRAHLELSLFHANKQEHYFAMADQMFNVQHVLWLVILKEYYFSIMIGKTTKKESPYSLQYLDFLMYVHIPTEL
jgi:hypothetical protein